MRYSVALGTLVFLFLCVTLFLLIWEDTHRPETFEQTSPREFLPISTPTPAVPEPTPRIDLGTGVGYTSTAGLTVTSPYFRFHFPQRMKVIEKQPHIDEPEAPPDASRQSELALATAILRDMQAAETEELGVIPQS